MSIIPYSPLQRGLLTGKIKPGHQFGEGDTREGSRWYKPENIESANALLAKIRTRCRRPRCNPLPTRHQLDHPPARHGCVLVGARDEKQVKENVKALDFTLTGDELKKIAQAVSEFQMVD